jgi:TolA-binding protein
VLTIETSPSAVFSRGVERGREFVSLDQGAIRVRVGGKADGRTVVLRAPDGEITGRCTVFSINVAASETREVAVDEGSVWVRIEGRAQRKVHAGEHYEPYAEHPPNEERQLRTPSFSESRVYSAETVRNKSAKVGSAVANLLFRLAMDRLLNEGLSEAARLFAEFAAAHPYDARAEHAGFLRVVSLSRAQLLEEARAAARAYLERHPRGLRAGEVEALLRF